METYDDNCKGCRPAILDVNTRKSLPDDHPMMKVALEIWNGLSLEDRKAWHRVTCQNSRDNHDQKAARAFVDKLQKAMQ